MSALLKRAFRPCTQPCFATRPPSLTPSHTWLHTPTLNQTHPDHAEPSHDRRSLTSQQAFRRASSSLVLMELASCTEDALLKAPVTGSVQPSFMDPRCSPSSASSVFSFSCRQGGARRWPTVYSQGPNR